MICGGKSHNKGPSELGEDGHRVDSFVREKVPELAHATLVSFRTQVVAGCLYHLTYEGYEGEVKVWRKPGHATGLQITLPNGTEYTS